MLELFGLAVPKNVNDRALGYLEMLMMEKYADCILTDSGGIQEGSVPFRHSLHTLRDETEWVETVAAGCELALTGADSSKIAVRGFYDFKPEGSKPDIYGDGHAADKIIEILKSS